MPHSSEVCSRTVRRRRWSISSPSRNIPTVTLVLPASSASSILHVRRDGDSKNRKRSLQLPTEEPRHPDQENAPLGIRFVENLEALIEVAEFLRKLKSVPGDMRGFSGGDRPFERRIRLRRRQQHLSLIHI